jgi:MFS family permease
MYLPSPVTGWLCDTLGCRWVAAAGALLLIGAGGAAAIVGSDVGGIIGALLLLGFGWNAGLIGGSGLLRDAPVPPSLRTRAEGVGELGAGAAAAMGSSGAGLVLTTGGLGLLGLVAAAPCLVILAAVAYTGRRHRSIIERDPALVTRRSLRPARPRRRQAPVRRRRRSEEAATRRDRGSEHGRDPRHVAADRT